MHKILSKSKVKICNCTNCWENSDTVENTDTMALHLLTRLFEIYQEEGKLPESIYYNI